ncbi:MAG: aspartate/glutamate racemase family protein [Chloroflexi bacterium]|nr:aspartate/glutamate racemase family protein [Chloroflexota bacterium]
MAQVLTPARARIGLIIPSSNQLTEVHFHRYAPSGVVTHVTRLRMTGANHVPLSELHPRIAEAARALADARCDLIVFHCTGSAMEAGLEAERQVIETIRQATGQPATTVASALLAAFQVLRARRLVLLSPYPKEINEHESAFLAQAGVEVVRDLAMNLPGGGAYAAVPPSVWEQVTLEHADPRADAYFLSCTNIHSLEAIEAIESKLQRPVIASNQAALWYSLRACGLREVVPGLGQLLHLDLPAPVST